MSFSCIGMGQHISYCLLSDRLWVGTPGFNSQQGQETFNFSIASRLALGHTQPPIQWVPGAVSLGIKQPRTTPMV
jgi:hypothetical protein